MPNPLGIQKSLDGGKSLEHIAFEGETDFHAMAVGYASHDIFLLNPEANSELAAGFYKRTSTDDQWNAVNAVGLEGEVSALALHPSDSNLVAAATSTGVYVSEDGGEQFDRITNEAARGTAVFINETELYYASYEESAKLTKYTITSKKEEQVTLPNLTQDAVAFISQNPANKDEIGLYTLQGEVFLTQDNGSTWLPLLQEGKVE
ncbi:group-specific protein [Planococcus donghaensis MPA1U2]|uniref:Group-specific protein n=1 Tax=Planococcus donghaensis MPA1U2 TaxID=933115 RepID=E7RD75_9BACL|nr:group-specific protein [Planococcus donghaensis MPA1U2]